MLPEQHPFGHDVASQTHCPVVLLHSCPEAHPAHAAPPVPQDVFDSEPYASHVPLLVQQPIGQELASHTHVPVVVLHSWPAGQAAHVTPLFPHDVLVSPVRASQAPAPVQQPAHIVPPQVHVPVVEHESPVAHEVHATPPVPHCELDCEA